MQTKIATIALEARLEHLSISDDTKKEAGPKEHVSQSRLYG
jgi:hypothetical protein